MVKRSRRRKISERDRGGPLSVARAATALLATLSAAAYLHEFVSLSRFSHARDVSMDVVTVWYPKLTEMVLGFKENGDTGQWNFHYMERVPTPEDVWPVKAATPVNRYKRRYTLTTCVPALFRDMNGKLPALMESIAAQTVSADEVVIAMSNVPGSHNSSQACQEAYVQLNNILIQSMAKQSNNTGNSIPLRVVCVGERVMEGPARNLAGRIASGDIISFVDSDDLEYPFRNKVILNLFECYAPNLRLLLHSFKGTVVHPYERLQRPLEALSSINSIACADQEPGLEVLHGVALYDTLQKTHKQWALRYDLAHGHLVAHRSVLDHVHFSSSYKGADSMFVRDVMYHYGRDDRAYIFMNRPLTKYIQPSQSYQDLLR